MSKRFKTFAKLDKKSDENLSDYYKVFIAMCKRQAGEILLDEEKGLEGLIDDIGEDHAKLILDRLELLSKLREIVKHPKFDERLKLCENNLDTPDWWESGKHDRELVRAVLKYGLYRSDHYILNDGEFPFSESERHYVRSLEVLKSFKFDDPTDLYKLAMGEIPSVSEEQSIETAITKLETVTGNKSDELMKEIPEENTKKDCVKSEEIQTPEVIVVKKSSEKDAPSQSALESDTEAVHYDTIKNDGNEFEENMGIAKIAETPSSEEENARPTEMNIAVTSVEGIENEEFVGKSSVHEENIVSMETLNKVEVVFKKDDTREEKYQTETETHEKCDYKINKDYPETELKSPEEKVEAPLKQNKLLQIKQEQCTDLHDGEPKIIETVVIEDEDTLPAKKIDTAGPSNQAEELRARFPDLEVFQPLMKLKQLDEMMLKGDVKDNLKSLSRVFDTSMVVKWFRDFALEKRISHIIYCVERGVWPVGKSYSAYSGCLGIDLDLPLNETVKRINSNDDKRSSSSTPDIITITTDHQTIKSSLSALQSQLHQSMSTMTSKSKKGQKRHIAIDVETERAKLHALLNNTTPPGQKSAWNEDDHEAGRRSTGSGLQPPPAHQPTTRSSMSQYKPTVTIPGTSSTLTPIDLSSSLPKMRIADILRKPTADMSEVQDFSMGKSRSSMGMSQISSSASGKGKLNDMLTKLMKKNNVPMDEAQPLSKEKKRRKLDEIVLGLSAAKQPEQKSIFGDPGLSLSSSKKPQITPSVSVTPANVQSQSHSHSNQNQKPFTITVTSVPGKSKYLQHFKFHLKTNLFFHRLYKRTITICIRFFWHGGFAKHEQFKFERKYECYDFASGAS